VMRIIGPALFINPKGEFQPGMCWKGEADHIVGATSGCGM
jgi:hypothetical protein